MNSRIISGASLRNKVALYPRLKNCYFAPHLSSKWDYSDISISHLLVSDMGVQGGGGGGGGGATECTKDGGGGGAGVNAFLSIFRLWTTRIIHGQETKNHGQKFEDRFL